MKPRIAVLKTDGTNCDQETIHAFNLAGADAQLVLLTQLKVQKDLLHRFDMLVIPGGFSYGDDIASGKVLALELQNILHDHLRQFIDAGKLIMGICNGFQVLVRTGLLPHFSEQQEVTLTDNQSRKFECRWVPLIVEDSACVFTRGLSGEIALPVAHAEGNFFASPAMVAEIEAQNLVVLRYAHSAYPDNPNGSLHNIAGICDSSGRVFGLMPHPERFVYSYQHPLHTRQQMVPIGRKIFENAVAYLGN
jgi:phosphoribosylformylglycinamidine synthase